MTSRYKNFIFRKPNGNGQIIQKKNFNRGQAEVKNVFIYGLIVLLFNSLINVNG